MAMYRRVAVDSDEPVQYAAAYVLKWRPEWGEPTALFVEADDRIAELAAQRDALLAACETIARATERDLTEAERCEGTCDVPVGMLEALDAAIAKARGGADDGPQA